MARRQMVHDGRVSPLEDENVPAGPKSAASSLARLAPWIVAALLLTLYLSTLTAGNTYDAVIYAQMVERAAGGGGVTLDFFAPQHVLHKPLAAGLTWLAQSAGVPVSGMVVLQVLAALGGAALGGLLVASLRPDCGLPLAVTTALAACLAGGTWFFATDGETNHLSLAFAAASLLPIRIMLREQAKRGVIAAAALSLAAAAAFHITLGTLWIALLVLTLARHRERLRDVTAMLAAASLLLLVAYVPRIVMLEATTPGWRLRHVVSFTKDSPGGGYLLANGFEPIAEWLYLTRTMALGASPLLEMGALLPWLWLLAGVAALLLRRGGPLLWLSGLWFVFTISLHGAWASQHLEFACFLTTPLAIFGACGVAALLPSAKGRLVTAAVQALFVGVIAGATWAGTIAPQLDPADNRYRRLTDMVVAATDPSDCVIASQLSGNESKVYITYFGLRRTLVPEFTMGPELTSAESIARFREKLAECCRSGGRLVALRELVEDVPGERVAWDAAAVRALMRELEPRPLVIDEATGHVSLYSLRCPE